MDKFSRLQVLVVDDVEEMRKILKTILLHVGFKSVVEAENGRAALQVLKNSSIDLVIADWNMPQLTGIELLREMQMNINMKYIPFLMLTSETDKDKVLTAIQAGVSDYIIKPCSAAVLEAKIRLILDQ